MTMTSPNPQTSSVSHRVRGWFRTNPVTMTIVAVLVVLFLITQSTAVIQGVPVGYDTVSMWLILSAPEVALGEVWRILSHGFIHLSVAHLLMNCLLIVFIGMTLERVLGWWRFALLYLGSIIGGAAAVLWFSPMTLTAGASGAGYGLMAALVVVMGLTARATRGAWVLILVNVGFSLIVPGVSLAGHIGGLLAGFLLTPLLYHLPRRMLRGGSSLRTTTVLTLCGVAVVLAVALIICLIAAQVALASFTGLTVTLE